VVDPADQRNAALIDGPSRSWPLVRSALVVAGLVFSALVGAFASSIEAWLLAGELAIMASAIWLSPRIGRPAALHIVSGSFILYQTIVLDVTRATPNIGVVWFLLVPSWTILWGRAWHMALWVPATALAIAWTAWRAPVGDPLWQHPLSLPNLLAVVGLSVVLAVGFHRERRRRERDFAAATRRAEEETRERESAEARVRSAEFARNRLLAMLSHELRSPMTGLALTADLLAEQTEAGEEALAPLARLQLSARATLRTLDDILDLVRLEDGVMPSRSEPFCLLELLEDAAEVVAPRTREAGLSLVVDVDPGLSERWVGDRARLRQVLLNLLGNAFKHTREGGVRVVARGSETGGGLDISVEDTGVGIAEDVVRDVFEPWQQGRDSTEVRGGVGLGLSISRDFVEAMGGTIWVEPREGGGTRLCFRVEAEPMPGRTLAARDQPPALEQPVALEGGSAWERARVEAWARAWDIALDEGATARLALADHPEAQWRASALRDALLSATGMVLPDARDASRGSAQRVSLDGRRLQVVDDDATVRDVVARVFRRAGAEVDVSPDGEQAESALRSTRYDLMVLDLEMPGRTGLELLASLHADGVDVPPVVVLSGSLGAKAAALAAGADAFVVKPVRAAELLSLTADLLER
jgi:signal transduction histidine kinase/BarA-like signal transduction histidine kinase